MAAPRADSVSELLRCVDSRPAALEALEALETPVDPALALASAPALAELLAVEEAAVPAQQFSRIALLLSRLHEEALDDAAALSAVYGAAFGDGRLAAYWSSADNSVARILGNPANELTRADARTLACGELCPAGASAHGSTKPWGAAGLSAMEFFGLFMSVNKVGAR